MRSSRYCRSPVDDGGEVQSPRRRSHSHSFKFLLEHRVTRIRDSDTWAAEYRWNDGESSRRFGSSSCPHPRRSTGETVKVECGHKEGNCLSFRIPMRIFTASLIHGGWSFAITSGRKDPGQSITRSRFIVLQSSFVRARRGLSVLLYRISYIETPTM
jgi:hypothetical protein